VSLQLSTTDGAPREGAVGRGYFAPLTTVTYMLLTTFKPGNTPSSTRVRLVADGDRAYFRARSSSGTCKRLRQTESGWVQVAPSTALGLYTCGPPLDAIARPLAGRNADAPALPRLFEPHRERPRLVGGRELGGAQREENPFGMYSRGFSPRPPRSMSSTDVAGSALSRFASTAPAPPAPTMTKS